MEDKALFTPRRRREVLRRKVLRTWRPTDQGRHVTVEVACV